MKTVREPVPSVRELSARSDGAMTRFLLMLVALGTSLMLLGGALVPSADDDGGALALDLVASSVERLKEFLGG